MCGGNTDCLESNNYYNPDGYYDGDEEDYSGQSGQNDGGYDNGYRSYIDGGADSLNHQTTSAKSNYWPYIAIGSVLTAVIMAMVWRKRVSDLE